MLADYRELQDGKGDTLALDEHLAHCAACRQALAQQTGIGESLRALPSLEPLPEAQSRLMQALAAEQVRHMQRSVASAVTPPPTFLKPYIRAHLQKTPQTEALTAFSTADTGPLPVIQVPRRRPRLQQMNPFAIVGIAAAFLMVVMMGGLTSLLLLTHNGLSSVGDTASINNFVQVSRTSYTTTTPYPHVVSAVANRNTIYYTAYGDGSTGWMLEEFDTKANFSTPLLSSESETPLVVLGTSQNWLVWLQLDVLKPVSAKQPLVHNAPQERTWSLHALNLDSTNQSTATPVTLLKDTFNEGTAPSWVNNPVQGISFTEQSLLVATLDAKGDAHLWQFKLGGKTPGQPTELASASNGHIITSPTANSSGSSIYWSEEWQGDGAVLHSNIWTQQAAPVIPNKTGKWVQHVESSKYLFSADEMSFHPQVVNDTLFYLSTNPLATAGGTQTASGLVKPAATATADTVPTVATQATSVATQPVTTKVDSTIITSSPDQAIQGTLLAVRPESAQPIEMDSTGLDTIPQGGSRFIVWQNSIKGLEMYDEVSRTPVVVKDVVPKDAKFMMVNGESAVWSMNTDSATANTDITGPAVTFSMFNWPTNTQEKP